MPRPEAKIKAMLSSTISSAALLLLLAAPSDAFFRNRMIGALGMLRVDPIVNPGEASQHCHHLNGGSNLGLNSSGDDLAASTCTTSVVTQDKSAYWAPWLYFQHENGDLEPVNLTAGLTAYYKLEKRPYVEDSPFKVFPRGFRMIAGDSKKRKWIGSWPVPETSLWSKTDTSQEALAEKSIGFNCLNYASHNEPTFGFPYLRSKEFIDGNCPDGLRAEILFPSCWDGKNLDSDDHKSHVAYPPMLQDGKCPDTHPVYLPIIFYETIWNTPAFKGVAGEFVLANGDPTGYGYHGDFLAAWDDGVLDAAMNDPSCTSQDPYAPDPNISGEIEKCNTFQGHLQTDAEAGQCKMAIPDILASDKVEGIIPALPGDVKITGKRRDPGGLFDGSDEDSSSATLTSSAWNDVPSPTSHSSVASSNIVEALSEAPPAPTPAPAAVNAVAAAAVPGAQGQPITTTFTSAGVVVEMILYEEYETVTVTATPTETVTAAVDHARLKRHLHNHAHAHDRRHAHPLVHAHEQS